ncbi:hypothetical protein [uncultured Shewanella sp.]|uniref:hypothetical protein n=1 Tax=uncultured Shewanella sp. TaxID=173975 RepID=UPI00260D7D13|nr:hypothetical protein [uncultured Shewanella sp.]
MDVKLIAALVGLLGVFAGGLIQYYFGKLSEKTKKHIEIRSTAYLDLINAVSNLAGTAQFSEQRGIEQLQDLTKAKSRAIVVGSDLVVEKLHYFFNEHVSLKSHDNYIAFSDMVMAMRLDLTGKSSISLKMISEALFGIKS